MSWLKLRERKALSRLKLTPVEMSGGKRMGSGGAPCSCLVLLPEMIKFVSCNSTEAMNCFNYYHLFFKEKKICFM